MDKRIILPNLNGIKILIIAVSFFLLAFTTTSVYAALTLGTTTISSDATLILSPAAGLTIIGSTILSGSSNYINFGSITGISGYGFRDNGGIMEFKNLNGSWTGNGTVTGISVQNANGISGVVANPTTTPSITLILGAITPTSVAATGTVTGSNLSGTNTGDNAVNSLYSGLATSKQDTLVSGTNIKTINSISLLGAGDIALSTTDVTKLAILNNLSDLNNVVTARTNLGLGTLATQSGTFSGVSSGTNTGDQTNIPGNAATATTLAAPRTINGVSFNGSANITVPSDIAPGTSGNVLTSNGTLWTSATPSVSGANTSLSNLVSPAINANLVGAVAGGMALSGGSAANDDLILQGTTNATRTTSYVELQPNGGNVGIGTAAPGQALTVSGNSQITGHSALGASGIVNGTPSNNVFGIPNGSSTSTISSLIESTTNLSGLNGSFTAVTLNPAADQGNFSVGAATDIQTTGIHNFTAGILGAYTIAHHEGTGTVADLEGTFVGSFNDSSGIVTAMEGIQINGDNFGNGSVGIYKGFQSVYENDAGITTNVRLFSADSLALGGGAVTNLYGMYLEPMAGATNNYQIYSAGTAPSYFAGKVGIGTSAPGALLDVGLAGTALGVVRLAGSTSGNVSLQPNAVAGTGIILTLPAATGTLMINPMTTGGDIIYGGASGVATRLPNGTAGQVLQSNGTTLAPSWVAASGGANTALSNLASVAINTDLVGAVAGGMGIRGGTAANDDLILEGTTNATRTTSYVELQPNGGNVGIGTTSPAVKLQVAGTNTLYFDPSQAASGDIKIGSSIYSDGTNKNLNIMAGPLVGTVGATVTGIAYNGTAFRSMFEFANVSSGEPNLLLVKSGGNVGIGTATPAGALEINGTQTGLASNLGQLIIKDTTSTVAAGMGGQIAFGFKYNGATYANPAIIVGAKENVTSGDYAGYLAFATTANGGNNTEKMRISSAGNVGIGTAGPNYLLEVKSASNVGLNILNVTQQRAGLGLGLNSGATSGWLVGQDRSINGTKDFFIYDATSGITPLYISTADNVGIGTINPSTDKLVVIGDIRVGTSGTNGCLENFAGTALTGSCSSDIALKQNIIPITGILDNFLKLQPITYQWRVSEFPERHFGNEINKGLIAQDVEKLFPELVGIDGRGFKTVDYGVPLQILTIEAIKELNLKLDLVTSSIPTQGLSVDTFFNNLLARVSTWLGDAGNGIGDLFANRIHTKELCVAKSNGTEFCANGDQLDALLAGVSTQTPAPPVIPPTITPPTQPTPDTTPPIITLNGPAIINLNVGDVYAEQGAVAADDVDGTSSAVPSGVVDTSILGTYIITYDAVDNAGNHAVEVTRTVNVVTPSPSLPNTGSPGLPNTGLPPLQKNDPLDIVLPAGILILIGALGVVIYKKQLFR